MHRSRSQVWMIAVAGALLLGGIAIYLFKWQANLPPAHSRTHRVAADYPRALPVSDYIGAEACAQCHQNEFNAWRGSHHDLAMQNASARSVLGNFDNQRFTYNGIASRFFKRDGEFFIRTDGPDGRLADFAIKYTFGVSPLQQYLVELPGGRLQALPFAWDSRDKSAGGQRWFHLYPNEKLTYRDALHWTRRSQNWNHMCAECHTTNFHKNFDAPSNAYRSEYAALDVACEACHGPGGRHRDWAQKKPGTDASVDKGLSVLFDERHRVSWPIDSKTGNPHRSVARTSDKELEICARCHARRGQISADYHYGAPLLDTHRPSLLREGLYYPDGQIQDEVFEYGSFLQSRMYREGVSCSDCHEPHSLKLRAQGNGLCLQCHAAARYATRAHHFHAEQSTGAVCVNCHMPGKLYMGVDFRRDHSLRIPRPDLSVTLGTPNACTQCHAEKSAKWAADKVLQWYGHQPQGLQQYAATLQAARAHTQDAEQPLLDLLANKNQPPLARATAAAELGAWLSPNSLSALEAAVRDESALVRLGALDALEALPSDLRWQVGRDLLHDPLRAIRVQAAGLFADVPAEQMSPQEQQYAGRARDEYLAEIALNADLPESHVNLGNFYLARQRYRDAETEYRRAINLDAGWAASYVNLADLLRQTGRDSEVETVLRAGLQQNQDSAALHFSLGLLQVRHKAMGAALASLRRAAQLAPANTHFTYVYAVALDSNGRRAEARAVLRRALQRAPADRELLSLQANWQ